MGDSIGALYMIYYNNTAEGKKELEKRRKSEEEASRRYEQKRREYIEKNKNRMNETVTVKTYCAYGSVSLRMTLREAIERGFFHNCIQFDDERDDR